ncbi:MAG: hypothetical protein DSY43_03805 [Gammaproteobacteria bacterium]|nr:MAG: hypothetical protein DSY43_03805 [Gammaproteobacteria bacterium]
MKRDKGIFLKWFSLSRHQRRVGARQLSEQINTDFEFQKDNILSGDKIIYTHGSANDTKTHFNALKQEFAGQSELLLTHAKIIVLIRREFEVKNHFKLFEKLWQQEKDFLLKNLNTRWLIATTDTFADYSDDDAVKGLSIACVCLLNTVKMQESERFLTNAKNNQDDKDKQICLDNEERFSLFDGTSVFKFGTDDTLRNMRWRLDKVAKMNIAGEILLEIFKRLQKFDTIYNRAKNRHTRDKTGWW